MFCARHLCYLQAQSYEVVVLNQGGFEEKTVDLAKELLDAVLRWVFGLDAYLVDGWWMLGWSVELLIVSVGFLVNCFLHTGVDGLILQV